MGKFFADLWNDPAKFVATVRAGMVFAAGAVATGLIPMPSGDFGAWLQYALPWLLGGGAAGMPAGQRNAPVYPRFEVKK